MGLRRLVPLNVGVTCALFFVCFFSPPLAKDSDADDHPSEDTFQFSKYSLSQVGLSVHLNDIMILSTEEFRNLFT